jgi:hypothetical protein
MSEIGRPAGHAIVFTERQMRMLDDALLYAEAMFADAQKRGHHPLGWSVNEQRIYQVARAKFGQEARRQLLR